MVRAPPRPVPVEMVGAVREDNRDNAMIFLMLTTEAEPQLVRRAKQAGAKGWIVKPFKHDLLLAAVRKLVGDA